jgi:tetratricopeptide (TPR) repeat protein
VLLRKNQMNADALYLRGRALYLQGNTDGACAHFAQCLKVDPDHAKAREQHKMIKTLTVCCGAASLPTFHTLTAVTLARC